MFLDQSSAESFFSEKIACDYSYFYNLQSVLNKCPLDKWGPPTPGHLAGHDVEYPVEDMVYVTSLLAEPGTLTVESGLPFTKPPGNGIAGFTIPVGKPSTATFQLSAGLHSVKVPALAGGQRFTFARGGEKMVATGSEGINTTEMSAIVCNVQTFTGVLTANGGSRGLRAGAGNAGAPVAKP